MTPQEDEGRRIRLRAGIVSLVTSIVLLGAKYIAYTWTGSTAILSDALESIVNVVAAIFALAAVWFAARPADRNHPYGHGKVEFLTAAFEGGSITFAALLIIYEAIRALLRGVEIQELNVGVAITFGAGLINAALGAYLIRTGRRHSSVALIADGRHVLSDFWTSVGVTFGLILVMVTGQLWLDPVVAIVVGLQLSWTGVRLVRQAAGGLLDEVDPSLLRGLVAAINGNLLPGIIRVHHVRAIRSGGFTHVDAHLVVPEFWTVEHGHDLSERFEQRIIAALPVAGEISFHTDPCRRAYCAACDVDACPIRRAAFVGRAPMTVEEIVQSDQALQQWAGRG